MDYQKIMSFVKEKTLNNGRWNFPFRSRYNHTLRVMKWAERLQKLEGGDIEIIKLACLFHDVGWDEKIEHNILSRDIADKYLSDIKYDSLKKEKVLEAIEYHCLRDEKRPLSIESLVVMDADILDEVGAVTIIWDAMASTYEDQPSYVKAYERIKKYFSGIKEKQSKLKTTTGKKLYIERVKIIDAFIRELEYELFLTIN
ncbi:MAG: HD domain-containing protein [Bacillota bacterium]